MNGVLYPELSNRADIMLHRCKVENRTGETRSNFRTAMAVFQVIPKLFVLL